MLRRARLYDSTACCLTKRAARRCTLSSLFVPPSNGRFWPGFRKRTRNTVTPIIMGYDHWTVFALIRRQQYIILYTSSRPSVAVLDFNRQTLSTCLMRKLLATPCHLMTLAKCLPGHATHYNSETFSSFRVVISRWRSEDTLRRALFISTQLGHQRCKNA